MPGRAALRWGLALLALALVAAPAVGQPSGAELYLKHCAGCHDSAEPASRAPRRDALGAMSPEVILYALDSGSMRPMAQDLSPAERLTLAVHLAGRSFGQADTAPETRCAAGTPAFKAALDGPAWNGWGAGLANARFQPAAAAGLSAATVGRLKVKWAFGFPGAFSMAAQPVVVGGRVFIGSADRKVYALDARTGCIHWVFETGGPVRAAVTIGARRGGGFAAYVGDLAARAYALDAETGALIWKVQVDAHRAARITGGPSLYDGVLYVPVSSIEEGTGTRSDYECCTFRGSVAALDAETGALSWKTYTIAEEPRPTVKNSLGTQMWGPAGAAVWSSPTVDAARGALYVATGNAYSRPAADTSDAVIALDLKTGRRLWHRQATPGDAFIVGCATGRSINCPEDPGPDHDFGQSPILARLADGRQVLAIAQKSGVAYGFDPDRGGEILWQTRVGKGGTLGGSEWGSAADGARLYVAVSDVRFGPGSAPGALKLNPDAGGGLHALDLATGRMEWSVPPVPCGERRQCSPALSAAVTAIPGVVFSGGVSGFLRAYASADGRLLWEVDTARDYATVNGVPARGGAMDAAGASVAGGMLYVGSGYQQWGGFPGNVLLAFAPEP